MDKTLVFQARRDLAQARDAQLRATLDCNISLVNFEVAQEAPLAADRQRQQEEP